MKICILEKQAKEVILNQWKIPAIILFYKKVNYASLKEQKTYVSAFIFRRIKCKMFTFFIYAYRLG